MHAPVLAALGAALAVTTACGDNLAIEPDPPGALLRATVVGAIDPAFAALSIAALDADRVAIARGVVTGDAFCPDCVGLDPALCPDACERTQVTLSVLDTTTGTRGPDLAIEQVFPRSFDHHVDLIDAVALGPDRVAVAWLDCDDARCGGLASKQSCTARYAVVDLVAGTTSPAITLYEDRFGHLQLVAHPERPQLLAVTGRTFASGAGVRAAILRDTGELEAPWIALGGVEARSPAATATDTGFAIVVEDRRPNDPPPATPCASSCACSGSFEIDAAAGGLYAYELASTGGPARRDLVALGLTDDRHLPDGHYHARESLAVMRRGSELAIATTQAIDMDAELFVGRGDTWGAAATFDSPIPLWIGVMGTADAVAWLGSQPEPGGGSATVHRLVAGVTGVDGQTYGALTEPVDAYVFEAAPHVTPAGVRTTFLLRGVFDRSGPQLRWGTFEIVKVTATW